MTTDAGDAASQMQGAVAAGDFDLARTLARRVLEQDNYPAPAPLIVPGEASRVALALALACEAKDDDTYRRMLVDALGDAAVVDALVAQSVFLAGWVASIEDPRRGEAWSADDVLDRLALVADEMGHGA